MSRSSLFTRLMRQTWPRDQKRRFYDDHDRMICVQLVALVRPWIKRLRTITVSLLDGFEQAVYSVDKNLKKSTRIMVHLKLLNRCGFLQAQSSHGNEKCADRPILSI